MYTYTHKIDAILQLISKPVLRRRLSMQFPANRHPMRFGLKGKKIRTASLAVDFSPLSSTVQQRSLCLSSDKELSHETFPRRLSFGAGLQFMRTSVHLRALARSATRIESSLSR